MDTNKKLLEHEPGEFVFICGSTYFFFENTASKTALLGIASWCNVDLLKVKSKLNLTW
jgi:hypothetical protein